MNHFKLQSEIKSNLIESFKRSQKQSKKIESYKSEYNVPGWGELFLVLWEYVLLIKERKKKEGKSENEVELIIHEWIRSYESIYFLKITYFLVL